MKLYSTAFGILFFGAVWMQAPAVHAASRMPLPPASNTPVWPKLAAPLVDTQDSICSKDLEVRYSTNAFGAFSVQVKGQPTAVAATEPIGYLKGEELKWFNPQESADRNILVSLRRNALQAALTCSDPDGGRWRFEHRLEPGRIGGTIEIEITISVDQPRQVAFLPMLTLFPGVGSFGAHKTQGLLAGLEYLEDEPGSSEADVVGPAAKRQVPNVAKLTFPLMAIQKGDRYVALAWQMRPQFCAVFDTPDRLFRSGGHVMGLLFPGSNGENREEGSLLPRFAETLHAGAPVVLRATLLGGSGTSVVNAVQHYIALRPLPPVPSELMPFSNYVALASGGWLDSKIREGNLVRHAILGGNFPPGQAADAGMWMDWLAAKVADTSASNRLIEVAASVLGAVPPPNLLHSGVGHVHYPVPPLLYGGVEESMGQAAARAKVLAQSFEPDGALRYHPRKEGPDYAKTHYSNEANGYTSRSVLDLLEAAAWCGDRELIDSGLQKLRALDKFRNGVPRGAQTWECPLHTPDILASAQMVRAYTLGYELSGDSRFLEQARYWAWTGVPFVYLVQPVSGPTGLYSTIAVFGATSWQAPVWLGLPVQWCGLVYADALYRLVRYDSKGPWKQIADGITLSGIQQSWPASERDTQGLLPDSFVLKTQHRNGPAINPATVQACAVRYYRQTPVYDFWCSSNSHLCVHAPGQINHAQEKSGRVVFEVEPAFHKPCLVLISGIQRQPRVLLNGKETDCSGPNRYDARSRTLVVQIATKTKVDLSLE